MRKERAEPLVGVCPSPKTGTSGPLRRNGLKMVWNRWATPPGPQRPTVDALPGDRHPQREAHAVGDVVIRAQATPPGPSLILLSELEGPARRAASTERPEDSLSEESPETGCMEAPRRGEPGSRLPGVVALGPPPPPAASSGAGVGVCLWFGCALGLGGRRGCPVAVGAALVFATSLPGRCQFPVLARRRGAHGFAVGNLARCLVLQVVRVPRARARRARILYLEATSKRGEGTPILETGHSKVTPAPGGRQAWSTDVSRRQLGRSW